MLNIYKVLILCAFVAFCNFAIAQNCITSSTYIMNPAPVNGQYQTGQTVQICATFTFSQAGAIWTHGIIPVIPAGWDVSSLQVTPPTSCSGSGTWAWYNSVTGTAGTAGTNGPGIFYNQGADANPGNNFGDNCIGSFSFCITLTTSDDCGGGALNGSNLNINFQILGDNLSGSWSSSSCGVSTIVTPPAFNSTLSCCSSDDVFATLCNPGPATALSTFLLGLTPGGVWTDPLSNASNGIFTPGTSLEGVYSYNVNIPGCISTSTVDVSIQASPTAGSAVNTTVCNTSPPFDLFDFLTGEDIGGTWTGPGNVAVPNIFTPGASTGGNYIYTVGDGITCPTDQETVVVTVVPLPNAGTDGVVGVCETEPIFNLFDQLGGSPDAGGTWLDEFGNASAGTFTPGVSVDGVYTYTVGTSPCQSSANVDVTTLVLPFAGADVLTTICANGSNVDLFNLLVGANTGGNWMDPLGNVWSGTFIPGVDIEGSYTYSLGSGTCFDSAIVDVTLTNPPEATIVAPASICEGDFFDVTFDILGNGPFDLVYTVNGIEYTLNNINNNHVENLALSATSTFAIVSVQSTVGVQCIGAGNNVLTTVIPTPTATIGGGGGICEGASSDIEFNFTGTGPFDIVYTDGIQNYTLNGISNGHLVSISPVTNVSYTLISVIDNSPLQCAGAISGTADFIITSAPEAEIIGNANICLGQSTPLTFDITGTGPFDIVYTDGTSNFTLNSINSGHIVDVSPIAQTTYQLVSVAVSSNAACTGVVNGSAQISVFSSPSVSNIDISCTATNEDYIVSFSINDGNPLAYNVVGSGSLSGNTFTSNPLPTGSSYSFTVSDGSPCPEIIVEGNHLCDCLSNAGSLQPGIIEVCGNSNANVISNNDAILDGNDILVYILHDGNANSLGATLATSATTSIDFQLGMTYGNTYYISAVVANNNGIGGVNLNDPCLSVSTGVPVVFNQPPMATLSGNLTLCEGLSGNLTVNLTGDAPWTFTYAINGINSGTINTNSQPYLLNVNAAGNYSLLSSSDANCVGTVQGASTVTLNPLPTATISGGGNICEGSNAGPLVTLTGGGPWNVSYSINNAPPFNLVINSSPYIISAINSGTYELLSVSNANCTGTVSGLTDVNIQPLPTATIAGGGNVCNGTTGEFEITGQGTGNVSVTYAINGVVSGTVELENGTSYFESDIPGIYTIVEVEDDFCVGYGGNSQAILTINPIPTANLSVTPNILCEGDSALINIALTGNGPFDMVYMIGNELIEIQNTNNINQYLTPLDGEEISLISISDNSNPTCSQALNQSVTFNVSPIPDLPQLEDVERCMYDEFSNIGTESLPGLDYIWTPSIGLSNPNIANPEFQLITNSTAEQTYNYTLNIDNGVCSVQSNVSVTVDPGPLVGFTYSPNPVTTESTLVNFYNSTPGINEYLWLVDSSFTYTTYNINHTFPDAIEGKYLVSLTATDPITGCYKTVSRIITIKGELNVYVPNAFSPNGDGINDLFSPVMRNYSEDNYSFTVVNRQGEIVFETTSANDKWGGEDLENEYYVQNDVYLWILKVKDLYSVEISEFSGTVTVLR